MKNIFLTGASGILGKAFGRSARSRGFNLGLGSRLQTSSLEPWQFFDLENVSNQLDLRPYDICVHLASTTDQLNSLYDLQGIEALIAIAKRDGIKHFVFISIVGVEVAPIKYFKTKRKCELVLMNSGLPYSIIRSTQFHEFFEQEIKNKINKKISIVPNLLYQPIDVAMVAQQLVAICSKQPIQGIKEIGGPQQLHFVDAIRAYKKKIGNRHWVISIPSFLLGKLGSVLTTKNQIAHSTSWTDYIENKKLNS